MGGYSLYPSASIVASWPKPNYVNPELHGSALTNVCIVFSVLSFAFVTGRIYARVFITRALGIDDLFCMVSLILSIVVSILVFISNKHYGIGRHTWDVPVSWIAPNRRLIWISELLIVISLSGVKISILLFYRRLSAPFTNAFRIATWIGIAYNIGYVISHTLALLLLCRPLNASWNRFSPPWLHAGHQFTCAREDVSLPLAGFFSVVGDLYSTVLPLILVWGLQMDIRRKLALYALFAVGFVVVGIGILRTVDFFRLSSVRDIMWEVYTVYIWTIIELNLAIMCASAPAVTSIFRHIFDQHSSTRLYQRYKKGPGVAGGNGSSDSYELQGEDPSAVSYDDKGDVKAPYVLGAYVRNV